MLLANETLHDLAAHIQIVERLMAVIEFDLQGYIQTANANFLRATGYTLDEIQGQHHRIFLFPKDTQTPDYAAMWQQLNQGQPVSGVFRRRRKDGSTLWIMGSYNPIFDKNGQPYKLVKYVLDVTHQKELEEEPQQALAETQTQEEELHQNMEELSAINDEMAEKNLIIEELNRELPDNYRAAVLFMPRDIVSGDFYWAGPARDGRIILAVGDGTGHGVPGSFMSLLGITTLQKHLDRGLTDPAELLATIHTDLQRLLAQRYSDLFDSIEMLIISLSPASADLRYASAMRPLYCVDGDRLSEFPYDRYSVGGRIVESETAAFTTHEIDMHPSRCLYLMSDGLQEQFGGYGDKPHRWGRSTMKETLAQLTREVPLRKRAAALARLHTDWRGYFVDQTDDICYVMRELAEA